MKPWLREYGGPLALLILAMALAAMGLCCLADAQLYMRDMPCSDVKR